MRIATKWADVSLTQYIQIADLLAIDMDDLDRQVKILAILSNELEDTIIKLSIPNLMTAIRHCKFIYTPPLAGHIKQYIKLGKHKFSINTDLNKLTGGEYIDYTNLVKDRNEVTRNLPKIISIFLHPVNFFNIKKSDKTLETRHKTAKIIEDSMNMDNVMMLSGFFLNSWQVLTKATIDFSALQTLKMSRELNKLIKEDSESIGVGI